MDKPSTPGVSAFVQALQATSALFSLAYIWHCAIFPAVYDAAGKRMMSYLSLHPREVSLLREEHLLREGQHVRDFALTGSLTHSFVFLVGLMLSKRVPRAKPLARLASLATVALCFQMMVQRMFNLIFSHYPDSVFARHANLIFHLEASEKPPHSLAWSTSASYTAALLLGFLLADDFHAKNFIRLMVPVAAVRPWIAWTVAPFSIWVFVLDRGLLSFLESGLGSRDAYIWSFLCGLATCTVLPVAYTLAKDCACQRTELDAFLPASYLENALDALRRSIVTLIFVSAPAVLLMGLSLVRVESMVQIFLPAVKNYIARDFPAVASSLVGSLLGAIGPYSREVVIGFVCFPVMLLTFDRFQASIKGGKPITDIWMHAIARNAREGSQLVAVACLWNTHLICYFGNMFPFLMWSFFSGDPSYGFGSAALDAFCFVHAGPYTGPVLIEAFLKIQVARARPRRTWGRREQRIFLLSSTLPLLLWLRLQWQMAAPGFPVTLVLTLLYAIYFQSYTNHPELSGSREWASLRDASWLWHGVERYFGFRVRAEAVLEPKGRIVGFHPHGLFPCTCVWFHLGLEFKRAFPRLRPRTMTDAFTHTVPCMRELAQWAGGLEVERSTLLRVLMEECRTAVLVPGGQSEILLHTSENLKAKVVMLEARHKGFVRLALAAGVELVPSFNFGELQSMKNIEMPFLQRFTRKYFGFPMPFWPVGILGLFPVPMKTRMTFVVGSPVGPKTLDVPGEPTKAEVDSLWKEYFEGLRRLFYKHRAEAGFADWTLILKGIDDIKKDGQCRTIDHSASM